MPSTDGSPDHKFSHDYRNRLIQVKTQADANIAKYHYDGLNRRVHKDLTSGTDVVYLYDGWQVVEERELDGENCRSTSLTALSLSKGEARRQFVYGRTYIDEPLLFDKDTDADGDCIDSGGSSRYFYAQQANFNVVAVTGSDGTIVEKIKYDPYGEAVVTVQGGQSASGNPYLFQGRRWDSEADLYYFRNRHMSPRLGRFLQRDPIGYDETLNLYTAMMSNPVLFADPLGLGGPSGELKVFYYNKVLGKIDHSGSLQRGGASFKARSLGVCSKWAYQKKLVGLVGELGKAVALGPIKAWKQVVGGAAGLVKGIVKKTMKNLWKQGRLLTDSTRGGDDKKCGCDILLTWDPDTKTFEGVLRGRIGERAETPRQVGFQREWRQCCEPLKAFAYKFSGTWKEVKKGRWLLSRMEKVIEKWQVKEAPEAIAPGKGEGK